MSSAIFKTSIASGTAYGWAISASPLLSGGNNGGVVSSIVDSDTHYVYNVDLSANGYILLSSSYTPTYEVPWSNVYFMATNESNSGRSNPKEFSANRFGIFGMGLAIPLSSVYEFDKNILDLWNELSYIPPTTTAGPTTTTTTAGPTTTTTTAGPTTTTDPSWGTEDDPRDCCEWPVPSTIFIDPKMISGDVINPNSPPIIVYNENTKKENNFLNIRVTTPPPPQKTTTTSTTPQPQSGPLIGIPTSMCIDSCKKLKF